MTDSRWLRNLIISLIAALGFVAAFNIWMDPYYIFENHHSFNQRQNYLVELYGKSFFLKKNGNSYDEFLIGGSNVSMMDTTKITDRKIFNYGVAGHSFLDINNSLSLVHRSAQNVKRFYICFNFYQYMGTAPRFLDFPEFFDNLDSELFKVRSLIGFEQTSLAWINFLNNFRPQIHDYYLDRNFAPRTDQQETKVINSKALLKRGIAKGEFDKTLENIQLREGIEYIAFTSPMHEERVRLYMRKIPGEYADWLRSLVKKFGKVYHFAYMGDHVTEKSGHFFAGNHFYTGLGDKMLSFLIDPAVGANQGPGLILDKSNIEKFLEEESAKFKEQAL